MATAIKKLDGRFDVWAGARSIGGVVHKGFNLEFLGNHVGWFPTRKEALSAAKLFIHHCMADLSDLSEKRSKNPAPRLGTKRPRRVSQITKKPPTKRLVTRRKANTQAGYFPNPTKREIAASIHDEFPQFVKVGFQGRAGETAGIVVPSYVVGTGTFASISRLFPFYEAAKMERLYVSDPFPTFEEAFAAKLNFRKAKK
jgi:hypothetical protein